MPAGRVMNDSLRFLCRTYSSRASNDGNAAENTKVEKKQDKRSGSNPLMEGCVLQLTSCSQFSKIRAPFPQSMGNTSIDH